MYLDDIALRIRSQVPATSLPDGDLIALFRIYAVLALARGEELELADVHNAWVAWMADIDSEHEALVPFERLGQDVAGTDFPYLDAIRKVASELRTGDAR
jgi:hypothetical protein